MYYLLRLLTGILVLPFAPLIFIACNLFEPKYSFADVMKAWAELYVLVEK